MPGTALVFAWANVVANDQVALFDTANPFETHGIEKPWVSSVTTGPGTTSLYVYLKEGPGTGANPYVPSGVYDASADEITDPENPTFDFSGGSSAGIGVVSGCDSASNQINDPGSCFFEGDMRGLELAYNDAYTEFFAPLDGMTAVPFVSEEWFNLYNDTYLWDFTTTWFSNLESTTAAADVPDGDSPDRATARHNYFQLIGGSTQWQQDGPITVYRLGYTNSGFDSSIIYRGSAEVVGELQQPPGTPEQIHLLSQHTAVHEFGHQFWLNLCVPFPNGGHDTRAAWCELTGDCGSQQCVMDVTAPMSDRWDEMNRFCREDLLEGDPTCPDPPSVQTAIRTQVDPF